MPKPPDRMKILWFIPTHGDGRYLGSAVGARPTTLPYLKQIAQAVDELGYYGALLPTGRSCDDAWVVASTLIPVTQRMKFLVAIRPGLTSPTLAARMDHTGPGQDAQMRRHCRRRRVEDPGDFSRRQPLVTPAYQQPKDLQPGTVSDGGQALNGLLIFHITSFPEIW